MTTELHYAPAALPARSQPQWRPPGAQLGPTPTQSHRNLDPRSPGLEKTLESPLDCKEIQPVHSEGDQPWDFFGKNDAEAETPVLWPPHAKS